MNKDRLSEYAPELYDALKNVLEEIPLIAGASRHDELAMRIQEAAKLIREIEKEYELKPCPFCGGKMTEDDVYFGECGARSYEGILSKTRRENSIGGACIYFVHCPHCDAHLGGLHKGDFGSPEEAIAEWNRRAAE